MRNYDKEKLHHRTKPSKYSFAAADRLQSIYGTQRIAQNEINSDNDDLVMGKFANQPFLGIFISIDQRIVKINKVVEEIYGYSQEEISAVSLGEIINMVHENEREDVRSYLLNKEYLTYNGPIEYRALHKDGHYIWIRQYTQQILYNNQIAVQAFVLDITRLKKIEENHLRNKQIHEFKELFEHFNMFASSIAHDFNNLLVGIMGNINILQECLNLSSEERLILTDIENATNEASNLASQLMTFVKEGKLRKEPCNILKLINESARFLLRGTDCTYQLQHPARIPLVEIDIGQMSQVFHNLILNAIQAMPDGGELLIELETVDIRAVKENLSLNSSVDNTVFLKISVIDSGIGIKEELKSNIFKRNFSTKQFGSGLGLPNALTIIEQHGGTITFTSRINKGSVFSVYLPSLKSNGQQDSEKSESKQEEYVENAEKRILVLDDEDTILITLSRLLKKLGYQVFTAKTGDDAISLLKRLKNDDCEVRAGIFDLTIPGGHGG